MFCCCEWILCCQCVRHWIRIYYRDSTYHELAISKLMFVRVRSMRVMASEFEDADGVCCSRAVSLNVVRTALDFAVFSAIAVRFWK